MNEPLQMQCDSSAFTGNGEEAQQKEGEQGKLNTKKKCLVIAVAAHTHTYTHESESTEPSDFCTPNKWPRSKQLENE